MIEPTSNDVGRFAVYIDDGSRDHPVVEAGRVTGFNEEVVFVAFPNARTLEVSRMACTRDRLFWLDDVARLRPGQPTEELIAFCESAAGDLISMERGEMDGEGLPRGSVCGDLGRQILRAVAKARKS